MKRTAVITITEEEDTLGIKIDFNPPVENKSKDYTHSVEAAMVAVKAVNDHFSKLMQEEDEEGEE